MYIIRPNKAKLEPLYLKMLLETERSLQIFTAFSSGTVLRSISADFLNKLQIPLPALEVQKKLAEKYAGIEVQREQLKNQLESLAEQKTRILDELKRREFEGYQYESAEASLELLVRRMAGKYKPAFALGSYKVITLDEKAGNPYSASAIVDLTVGGQSEITAGNGIGPVDALDCAFRRSMAHFYPETLDISLVDYKVRVIDSGEGTASKVRVFIEFAGEGVRFGTVGLSGDIIQASWDALVDAYEYWIMKKTGEKE